MVSWCLAAALAVPAGSVPPPIEVDRRWDVLVDPSGDLRAGVRVAGQRLAGWTLDFAGVPIDGARLVALADAAPEEPFVRVLREGLRRPVDPVDFLYFLDDVLATEARRGERYHVTSGRARDLGALVHPDEVWKGRTRIWPGSATVLPVDEPPPQTRFPVAVDGELSGPNWTMRYRSPEDRREMFETLAATRPDSTFAARVKSLVEQLEAQGCEVTLTSFLRFRERGYLMWGAFELSRAEDEDQAAVLRKLQAANEAWGKVPVVWSHPEGVDATREAARRMADAYNVVFASEQGARDSHHYDGTAVDMVVQGLPRALVLEGTDGVTGAFDLSDPDHPRDLSLEKELVAWIEAHFNLEKLRTDYPHWDDPDRG